MPGDIYGRTILSARNQERSSMGNRNTAFESWVEKHPYLREVAQLQQVMAGVMKEHRTGSRSILNRTRWNG